MYIEIEKIDCKDIFIHLQIYDNGNKIFQPIRVLWKSITIRQRRHRLLNITSIVFYGQNEELNFKKVFARGCQK